MHATPSTARPGSPRRSSARRARRGARGQRPRRGRAGGRPRGAGERGHGRRVSCALCRRHSRRLPAPRPPGRRAASMALSFDARRPTAAVPVGAPCRSLQRAAGAAMQLLSPPELATVFDLQGAPELAVRVEAEGVWRGNAGARRDGSAAASAALARPERRAACAAVPPAERAGQRLAGGRGGLLALGLPRRDRAPLTARPPSPGRSPHRLPRRRHLPPRARCRLPRPPGARGRGGGRGRGRRAERGRAALAPSTAKPCGLGRRRRQAGGGRASGRPRWERGRGGRRAGAGRRGATLPTPFVSALSPASIWHAQDGASAHG